MEAAKSLRSVELKTVYAKQMTQQRLQKKYERDMFVQYKSLYEREKRDENQMKQEIHKQNLHKAQALRIRNVRKYIKENERRTSTLPYQNSIEKSLMTVSTPRRTLVSAQNSKTDVKIRTASAHGFHARSS